MNYELMMVGPGESIDFSTGFFNQYMKQLLINSFYNRLLWVFNIWTHYLSVAAALVHAVN